MRGGQCGLVACALAVAGALAGCSSSHKQAPGERSQAPRREESPKRAEGRESAAILYRRTGGILGFDDRMVVWPDGFVQLSGRGNEGCVAGSAGGVVLDDVFQGWEGLRESYDARGADLIRVTIVYRGKSVTAVDSAEVPETFTRARQVLEEIMGRVRAKPAPVVPVPGS